MISIVGSRRTSGYSRAMAVRFAASLAESGFLVVSGMAGGIDGEANRAAMQTGAGTVAVLGCGVDICYPRSNEQLFRDLHTAGTILSEYPPGTEPEGWHFPQRNRIISGLSVASIIIGAPRRSGALITARLALDQGRDVYAVPGRLDDWLSDGCNELIRDSGAALLTDPIQLIHRYGNLLRNPPDERWIERVFRGQADSRARGTGTPPKAEEKRRREQAAPRSEAEEPQVEGLPQRKAAAPETESVPQTETLVSQTEVPEPRTEGVPPSETARQPESGAQAEKYSPDECRIIEAVRMGAQSTDRLIDATGMPAAQLLSLVTLLELEGVLRNEGGMIMLLK